MGNYISEEELESMTFLNNYNSKIIILDTLFNYLIFFNLNITQLI